MSHTPGPWKYTGTAEVGGILMRHIDGADLRVCFVPRVNWGPVYQETDEANIRLIEASPEILTALETLVKWMDDSGLSHTKPGGKGVLRYEGHEYSVVTEARAAIKKAKGEA